MQTGFQKEANMWLYIVLGVLFLLAIGGGGLGQSRGVAWGWSPAVVILVVAAVLYFTGHLSLHG